jgi:hypothetical protein
MWCNARSSRDGSQIIVPVNGEDRLTQRVEMNTLRQPAVHYPAAPAQQPIEQLQPRQAAGQGLRPILHLKAKKGRAMQSTGNDAAAELGIGRPRVPEGGNSR